MIYLLAYLVFGFVYAGLDVIGLYDGQGILPAILATLMMTPFWPVFLVRQITR